MPARFISDSYRKEFADSISRVNIARAKITSLAFIVIELMIMLVTLFVRKGDFLERNELYYCLMYILMILAMSFYYLIFLGLEKKLRENGKKIQITGIFFTGFILLWCGGISLLDQLGSGEIMVYNIAAICIAVVPLFRALDMLLIYLPIHTAFLAALICLHRPGGLPFGDIVNSTAFVAISWVVSYMRFNGHAMSFNDTKLIEEKSAELEKTNEELREANKKLELLSLTDGLTGVSNRSMFDRTISLEWDRCRRQFITLSLIMVDIDYFKAFNDHYGHLAGDNCIRRVAETLSSCAKRGSDLVARYGGEEFAVILPCTDSNSAWELAELMRKRVEELRIPHAYSCISGFVTISLGVYSAQPSDEQPAEKLIENADKSLYEAKIRHNEVVVYGRPCGGKDFGGSSEEQ